MAAGSTTSPKTHARRQLTAAITDLRKWMVAHEGAKLTNNDLKVLQRKAAALHNAITAWEMFMR